jgi:nitrogen-specific signal transduction histidine kinase
MGLSVAHGIISEHHGMIEVESEPGRGTTFNVYIPVLEEDAT